MVGCIVGGSWCVLFVGLLNLLLWGDSGLCVLWWTVVGFDVCDS